MDLGFDDGTAAVDAAAAITAVEREVRGKYPMIKRLFIEAGAAPAQWRWSRPDSTDVPPDARWSSPSTERGTPGTPYPSHRTEAPRAPRSTGPLASHGKPASDKRADE